MSFGLATWGSYLCKVADVQEELTKKAVDEYLQEVKRDDKHFMLEAGKQQPVLMQNGEDAEAPSVQRLMLTNNANPYTAKPHSEATMAKYNAQPQVAVPTYVQPMMMVGPGGAQQPMMMVQSPMAAGGQPQMQAIAMQP